MPPMPDATAAADDAGAAPPSGVDAEAMNAYRESMRARFDQYMQERQARHEENMRRQREQHEAAMEQGRTEAGRRFNAPYNPYPPMPGYGPRYPAAFPGYRTPYWQQ